MILHFVSEHSDAIRIPNVDAFCKNMKRATDIILIGETVLDDNTTIEEGILFLNTKYRDGKWYVEIRGRISLYVALKTSEEGFVEKAKRIVLRYDDSFVMPNNGYLQDRDGLLGIYAMRLFDACGRLYFDPKTHSLIITYDCIYLEGWRKIGPKR